MKFCKHKPRLECKWDVFCENYNCHYDKIDSQTCTHADTTLVVLAIVATCETTAIQCDYCGKILTEPKTDCT